MKKILHITLWFLAFFNGIIRLLELNVAIVRIGVPLIIIFLLLHTINRNGIKLPYLGIIIFLLAAIVFSGLINSIATFQLIDFITYLIFPYLYFCIIYNEKNVKILQVIQKTIIFLFALQIPASIIKYILVGQMEEYIGTVSTNAGSLSTVIPMIATSFLFSKYLYRRSKTDLIYIIMFILFGLIGEKRAIVFFVPLIMLIIYLIFLYYGGLKTGYKIKIALQTILLGMILVYLMVILNPTLTPEGKIGGSFDLKYVLEYTQGYNTSKAIDRGEISRFDGLIYFINYLYEGSMTSFLFGEGAGKLLTTESNPMLDFYGVRYGGRMGFIWLYLQIGLIGSFLYLFLLFKMLTFVKKKLKKKDMNFHYLAFVGIWISIVIDTIIYSSSSLMYFVISGVIFFYYGLIFLDEKYKNVLILK